jgi:hypothetical protein
MITRMMSGFNPNTKHSFAEAIRAKGCFYDYYSSKESSRVILLEVMQNGKRENL